MLSILFYMINHWTFTQAELNVALLKDVTFCDKNVLYDVIVNGDTATEEIISDDCSPLAYLKIDLKKNYFVHYVVVYEGAYETYEGQLDYFTVYVEIDNIPHVCSEYPSPSKRTSSNMRVNCGLTFKAVKMVELRSNVNKGFKITELEIFTLGSEDPSSHVELTRGCLKDFPSKDSMELISFRECQRFCFSNKYTFLAIIRNQTCHCGNDYNQESEIETKRCNIKCGGVDLYCGGYRVYSLYLIMLHLPQYVGCKSHNEQADVETRDERMTISKCLLTCRNNTRAMLKGGSTCICSDESNFNEFDSSQKCNITCSGSPEFYCGGTNYASVYNTCTVSPASLSCSELFRCNDTWNEYGVCPQGCEDNFYGMHCLQRESKCRTHDPCINISNTECNIENETYTCGCLSGFSKTKDDSCIDINECKNEPCNTVTSECENVVGSYYCRCKLFYFEFEDDICRGNSTTPDPWAKVMVLFNFLLKVLPVAVIFLTIIIITAVCRRRGKFNEPSPSGDTDIKSDDSEKTIKEPIKISPAVVFKTSTRSKSPKDLKSSPTRSKKPKGLKPSETRSKSPKGLKSSRSKSKSPKDLKISQSSRKTIILNKIRLSTRRFSF